MSIELKKEIERLGDRFKVSCETGLGRVRSKVDSKHWFDFLSLVKMENTLSFQRLHCLTAVRAEGGIFLVVELSSPHWHETLSVRSLHERARTVDSVSMLWPYADWLEGEINDLYGIDFVRRADGYQNLPEGTWSRIPELSQGEGRA